MTASDKPTVNDASPEQALALVNQNRDRLMLALEGQFTEVWQALSCLPDDHPRKESAMNALQQAWTANGALVEIMQQAHNAVAAIIATANEVRAQRDQIAYEFDGLITAIENNWMTDHPLIRELHERIADTHNAAFWESLPYDMAAALGGQWNFMDADLLYSILITDPEEMWEDGSDFGFTPEQLAAFRQNLLVMMRSFVAQIEVRNGK